MGLVTANGFDITEAKVNLCRQGPWNATIVMDTDQAPSIGDAVTIQLGSLELKGTARNSGSFLSTTEVEIVGGKNGFSTPATPKFYQGIPSGSVIKDLLDGGGESLASTVDPSLLTVLFSNWTTIKQPTGSALSNVVNILGDELVWRTLPDGTVWIGTDTWQAANFEYDLLTKDDYTNRWDIATVDPGVLSPGVTLEGKKVDYVEVHVGTASLRTRVWFKQ